MKSDVLNHGFVHFVDFMGGDHDVVNSARVLHEKMIEPSAMYDAESGEKHVALLRSMMEGRHGTPFEHSVFKFRVKLPIFVVREWQRHRISSYNEISMRWMTAVEEFYVPLPMNVRRVKDGARKIDYSYEQADRDTAEQFILGLEEFHSISYQSYVNALACGIAPEQARYFLPVTFFTQMIWTVNARSLMNFISLRNERGAQWELRQYAQAIENMFRISMPETWEAFNWKAARRSP